MAKSAHSPRRNHCCLVRSARAPRNHATWQFLGMLAVSLALSGAPVTQAAASGIEVTVDDGYLSADLAQVPLTDVLTAIAEQTGAQLSIRGELGNVRPQAFSRVPLAEALSRLAQPNGLILQFAPSANRSEESRLIAIRAIAPGAAAGDGSREAGVTPLVSRRDPRRGTPSGFWDYERDGDKLPSVDERIASLGKIVRTRGRAATAALVYVLVSDPDPAARRAALGHLAAVESDDARLAMTQAAADTDPDVRADALRGLARTGNEKPVSLLTQAAKGDTDANVRLTAIQLLSGSDGDLARAVLQGILTDPDPGMREAAQQSLRK
jgi:HEAT repeats